MGQVFLVRHGQASFGSEDYDRLSDLGVKQSRLLGEWFAACGQTFSSAAMGAMLRHRQTAEACLAAMPADLKPGAATAVEPGLNEYDHHEVMVRYRPEFATPAGGARVLAASDNPRRLFQKLFMEAMARWIGGEHDAEYVESWSAFRARCIGSLQRLVEKAGASQNLVVFTSGGPISVICQHLLGVADRDAAMLNSSLVNSGVTRLLYQPGRISLHTLNGFAHLERHRDSSLVTYR